MVDAPPLRRRSAQPCEDHLNLVRTGSVGTKVVETVGTQQGAQAVSTEVVETKGTDRNFEVP